MTTTENNPRATTETPKTVTTERSFDAKKAAATFAAYLFIAMPYNMAMAADWQTPAQVAALGTEAAPQATSITVTTKTITPSYFQITYQDVADEVENQLMAQGVETKARATTNPAPTPTVYAADHPIKLTLHALQIDPGSRQWQAQAYITSNGQTETVKPVAGHYESIVTVPVLTRQLRGGDIIEQADLTTRDMLSRQLRKDTITSADALLGKSPRGQVSAGRPIRQAEISAPVLVKKGDLVEMRYTSPFMSIKTSGIALEDGAENGPIRVKNEKSEKAVSARVVGAGAVEVNTETAM